MRILLLDGCRLNAWLLGSLAPPEVRIRLTDSFAEAIAILETDPPDAAIFNVTPADLPWEQLAAACAAKSPPVPFIWSSPLVDDELVASLPIAGDAVLRAKPVSIRETRRVLNELVERAAERQRRRSVRSSGESPRYDRTRG